METLRNAVIMAGPVNLLLMMVVLTASNQTLRLSVLGLQFAILLAQLGGAAYLIFNH